VSATTAPNRLRWKMSGSPAYSLVAISVNTVKTHLGSIYRKLGAADRRQAVRCARHLKVI
jgi:Bacterial regulatory proteins, luxR family